MSDRDMCDGIEAACKKWGTQSVCETATRLHKQSQEIEALKKEPEDVIQAGCILLASQRARLDVTFEDISQRSDVPAQHIRRICDVIDKHQDQLEPPRETGNIQEDSSQLLPDGESYFAELGYFFRDTAPITLSFAFQNVIQAWSILVCGRLGTFQLSVASYGYMFFSCTASMIAIGGSTALDTICSQAFAASQAAENKGYLGVVLQRALLFLTIFFFAIIAPLWWNSGPLFRFLGQNPEFADATEDFLKHMLPAGVLNVLAECLKKQLQIQNHRIAVGWCIGFAAVIGAIANYVLVLKTPLGVKGSALAYAVYHGLTVIAMAAFILSNESARSYWGGFSRQALSDLGPFVFLALTGMLTVATEFWCFESIALMAATLNPASVGAQSIIMTSDLIFATLPLGLSVASSHRIGKSLGAGRGGFARFQTRIPYLIGIIMGTVECILLLSLRNIYGRFFSADQDVVSTTAKVLPLLAIFQCLDISNGGAAGILRGAGKTHLSGASNVAGYYGVGLVLAYTYCFNLGLGLYGLWAGLITGSATVLILQSIVVFMIKWEEEADAVALRTRQTVADEQTPLLA